MKKLLTSFVAILFVLFAVSFAMAGDLNVTIDEVSVNDVSGSVTLAGYPGENVPIKVKFTANEDLDDVKLKLWIDGYKNDISVSTARFDVLEGNTYIKKLSVTLPGVEDLDDLSEDLTLHVRISDKNDEVETEYDIEMQRENFVFDLLSVEAPSLASAGDIVAIDVVLKNTGTEELEDAFVTATISELGISKKVYFGDLTAEDDEDSDGKQDARERRIYLVIPSDAITGDYDLVIKASNYDISETLVEEITINGLTVEGSDDAIDTSDKDSNVPSSVVVLTIVLVVIFVVLLIVLIVLLTRRPAESTEEDFGETSYY